MNSRIFPIYNLQYNKVKYCRPVAQRHSYRGSKRKKKAMNEPADL